MEKPVYMRRELSLASDHLIAKHNKFSGKISPWAKEGLKCKVAFGHC